MSLHSNRLCMLVVLGACAIASCQNDAPIRGVDKPTAPVVQGTLDAYNAPTAMLGIDVLAQTFAQAATRVAAVDALGVEQAVIHGVSVGLSELETNSTQAALTASAPSMPPASNGVAAHAQALMVQGDGYLLVDRICDGWGPTPVPSLENGRMQLVVGFTEVGVDPVVWGTLQSCKYKIGERLVLLEGSSPDPSQGDVRVFIGNNVQIATFGTFPDPLLVDLSARAFVDGNEVVGLFSFRIDIVTRAVEMLIPLAMGHVIVGFDPARSSIATVRALNGVFNCDLDQRRCTGPLGEELLAP